MSDRGLYPGTSVRSKNARNRSLFKSSKWKASVMTIAIILALVISVSLVHWSPKHPEESPAEIEVQTVIPMLAVIY
ncbi:MAG TPA: hypothetical protein ENN25_05855 [Euryarchaeota archaeon]|nr:hypothetical protein [Euryarchaeota archaeon]